MQLILITPDGEAKLILRRQDADGFLPAVRRHLGHGCQTAEPMCLGTKLTAWVDEDGLSKELEPNPVGTSLLVGLVPAMAASLLNGGFLGSIVLSGGLDGDTFTGLPDGIVQPLIEATNTIARGFAPEPTS